MVTDLSRRKPAIIRDGRRRGSFRESRFGDDRRQHDQRQHSHRQRRRPLREFRSVTIDDGTISDNTATDSGGGLFANLGQITIEDSTIGTSAGSEGGGIWNGTSLSITARPSFKTRPAPMAAASSTAADLQRATRPSAATRPITSSHPPPDALLASAFPRTGRRGLRGGQEQVFSRGLDRSWDDPFQTVPSRGSN